MVLLTGCGWGPAASAPPALPLGFVPTTIVFSSPKDGIMAGTSHCPSACEVDVARTADGGHTWVLLLHIAVGQFTTPTAGGNGSGLLWVTYRDCKVQGPPSGCATVSALSTSNGQKKLWLMGDATNMPLLAFWGSHGWAYANSPDSSYVGLSQMTVAFGGNGMSGAGVSDPCTPHEESTTAISALGTSGALLLCTSQPGAGNEGKDLFETQNGAGSWTHVLSVPFGSPTPVGGLPSQGYATGMAFLQDGHGWLWEERGSLYATTDFGRTWQSLSVTTPESIEARSVSFTNDLQGYLLLDDMARGSMDLMETANGGSTWHLVHSWTTSGS